LTRLPFPWYFARPSALSQTGPVLGRQVTPGRRVGADEQEDDGEPLEEKVKGLTVTLRGQQAEAAKSVEAIARDLASLGLWDGGGQRERPYPINRQGLFVE